MSENTAAAACTEFEWNAARSAGLPIFTTTDERAIHSFAQQIRDEQRARVATFIEALNDKLRRAYLLCGEHELTGMSEYLEQANTLFAEVRAAVQRFRDTGEVSA